MGPYYDHIVMMTLPLQTTAAYRADAGSWSFDRGAVGRHATRIWNWVKPRSNDYPLIPPAYATGWDWPPLYRERPDGFGMFLR